MYKYWILLGFILQQIKGNNELIQVQIIWRHGVRDFYYCNWGCDKNNEPDGDAQILTSAGMRQQFILGSWIRQRYILDNQFLQSIFNENEIYIESTDYNRTIMSAYSNLQGMYPLGQQIPDVTNDKLLPPNKGAISPNIGKDALPNRISIIPIHTKEEYQDYALAIYCKTTGLINKQNKQTQLYYQINELNKTKDLFQMFNKEMNFKENEQINDIIELAKWRDTFTCNRYNGDPLPDKLSAKTLFYMDKIALLSFSLRQFQTWEQSKRYSTPYLQQVLQRFENLINGTSTVKYYGSSSHDSTMLGILSGLNLTSAQCQADIYVNGTTQNKFCLTENVEFSSNLIFEFYNNSITGYSVRLLYNGLYVPLCSETGTYCQYDHFKQLLQNQFIDYEQECDLKEKQNIQIVQRTPLWAIIFFIICIILAIGIIFFILQKKSKIDQSNISSILSSDSTLKQVQKQNEETNEEEQKQQEI